MADALAVHPVTPERWPDLERLAEAPGPRGGTPILGSCWCGAWTGNRRQWRPVRKQAMRDLACDGHQPGLLAYRDGEPVGWVAVGSPVTFAGLERAQFMRGRQRDDVTLSILCFFVPPTERRRGISSALLDGAIEFARKSGARAIEGYPMRELSPHAMRSARAEQGFSFMGRRQAFESRGFVHVRDVGSRCILRLEL